MKPVILIDFNNLMHRMHWAHRGLSSNGKPTGLTYGVIKTIHDLREHVSPRLIFAWDNGVPVPGAARPRNWRDAILPTYKATRKHDDGAWADIVPQLKPLHDLIGWLGYSNVAVMGMEADDVIGVLANEIEGEVLIFSTDKDFCQLLDGQRVKILVPKKSKAGFVKVAASAVEDELGFSMARFAEYLALGGDNSDNIKPVRGMGPKTAIKMIQGGADLRASFSQQHYMFREKFAKYEAAWPAIQRSHECSRIPTSWKDTRVSKLVESSASFLQTTGDLAAMARQAWPCNAAEKEAKESFVKFCADREMTSLLALRHQLFKSEEEEKECQSRVIPVPARTAAKRSLFR